MGTIKYVTKFNDTPTSQFTRQRRCCAWN